MLAMFFASQMVKFSLILSIQFATGLLVHVTDVKVNYTRKINHFVFIFLPLLLLTVMPYEKNYLTNSLEMLVTLIVLLVYVEPLREKIRFLQIGFKSFDRPEDRPHTIRWLFTQFLASYLVTIPMYLLYSNYGLLDYFLIPLLIAAIGDGLAEPIGVKWGKHKYATYALFTHKKYVRSLEGSACVLITGFLILGLSHEMFTTSQFIWAMLILPVGMTIAEAISPHTWDSPLLFLLGTGALFLILQFA